MQGALELFAEAIGWKVRRGNAIVEGDSDMKLLGIARHLYREAHGVDIGENLAILAAGQGDNGGVGGVNRRLNAARQYAEVDTTPEGVPKYRFIALFDNDGAGRRGMDGACQFDRRIVRYEDVFLLHPKMPPAGGAPGRVVEARAKVLNSDHPGLDWEIEDLLAPSFLAAFEEEHPTAVDRTNTVGGLTHRKLNPQGKRDLVRFVTDWADLSDVTDLVHLTRRLRDYLNLRHDHIEI